MHKRTKALQIPMHVKRIVAERDSWDGWPCCILCGSPNAACNAHVVPRSAGGRGIPENVITLCQDCHRELDQGGNRKELAQKVRDYLVSVYPGWDEGDLIYRKN